MSESPSIRPAASPHNQRILIAGCGAVGSMLGCLLRQAGHDVTLLGRDWHMKAIQARGLSMDGIWGHHRAEGFSTATDPSELAGSFALIVIAVKSYDTESMIAAVAGRLEEDGLVLSLQNGLGNVETLARRVGAERSLGAKVLVGADIPEPGKVRVTVQAAPIVVGPLEVSDCVLMENIHRWIRAFGAAGVPCEATPDILAHLWAKVFYNAPLNALGALLNVPYGALGGEPALREIMNGIIAEAFGVAQRQGVGCLWQTEEAYLDYFYGHLLPATAGHRSSMLQDLERGRRTEIDAINGRIWHYGTILGIATPYNETLTRLIRHREKSGVAAASGGPWQLA